MEEKKNKDGIGKKILKGFLTFFRAIGTIFLVMFKTLFILCVLALLALVGIGFYKVYPMYKDYKSQVAGVVENSTLDTFRLQEASFIYDANGEILAKLTGDEDSSYLPYDSGACGQRVCRD